MVACCITMTSEPSSCKVSTAHLDPSHWGHDLLGRVVHIHFQRCLHVLLDHCVHYNFFLELEVLAFHSIIHLLLFFLVHFTRCLINLPIFKKKSCLWSMYFSFDLCLSFLCHSHHTLLSVSLSLSYTFSLNSLLYSLLFFPVYFSIKCFLLYSAVVHFLIIYYLWVCSVFF